MRKAFQVPEGSRDYEKIVPQVVKFEQEKQLLENQFLDNYRGRDRNHKKGKNRIFKSKEKEVKKHKKKVSVV